jgi:hypothetical protein
MLSWTRCERLGSTGSAPAVDAFDADVLIYAAVSGHPLASGPCSLLGRSLLIGALPGSARFSSCPSSCRSLCGTAPAASWPSWVHCWAVSI